MFSSVAHAQVDLANLRAIAVADNYFVVIVIESVNADQAQRANEAMSDLEELLEEFFGIKPDKSVILTKDAPSVDVD